MLCYVKGPATNNTASPLTVLPDVADPLGFF